MHNYRVARLIAGAMVLVLLSVAPRAGSDEIFVTISGGQLGPVPGEVAIKGMEGKLKALGFGWENIKPFDPVTQQVTGQRQLSPLRITREPGKASPRLFAAWINNELLPAVLIEFWVLRKTTGAMTLYQTVKLTNARIRSISRTAQPSPELASGQVKTLEAIEFLYQTVELRDIEANLAALDTVGLPAN